MTIEKGQLWGVPWSSGDGPDPVVLSDDAALGEHLTRLLAEAPTGAEREPIVVTVERGDLLRTIGLDRPRPQAERHLYPIDVGLARLDRRGREPVVAAFAAHLTVGGRPLVGFGPGLAAVVMNAAWLNRLRLGPRAHPNDGRLDVTEGTVGLAQRREANRRARTGAHLPHPDLRASRVEHWERSWNRPVPVRLDGVGRGRFHRVTVDVVADAAAVVA